jgi:hypothetical protein
MDLNNRLNMLNKELAELNAYILPARREKTILMKKVRELERTEENINNIIRELEVKIKNVKDLILTEDIFRPFESTYGYNLLTELDKLHIYHGMDKINYQELDENLPRYIDLEKIINFIIDIKSRYINFILISVKIGKQITLLPPKTDYVYTFKTPEGGILTI